MRVLVIEDFAPLRTALVKGLQENGFAVDAAADGQEGWWHARSGEHDVIILDLMLPKVDGLSILRELRKIKSPAHVLVLTAKDTADDRIKGLDQGADDYLVKPFVFAELLARIRALVRRKYETRSTVVTVGDLELDTAGRVVKRAGRTIDLSAREYAFLEYLSLNADRVVSREDLWKHVYDFNATLESNVVDVFVGMVRRKIERPGLRRLLHTRRGLGYMLSSREGLDGEGE